MPPSASPPSTDRSGDPLFGLVTGLYVALLATAPVVYAVARLGVNDSGTLYGTVLVTLTVVVGAGWWATGQADGPAQRLGATRARWTLGLVGLGYAVAGLSSLELTGAIGVLAMFFGMGAMGLGGALSVMARTRYTDAAVAGSERDCEFTAGWPDAARRRALVLAVPLWLLGAVGFVAVYVAPDFWAFSVVQFLFPTGIGVYSRTEPKEYTVTAAGLEQHLYVARRLFAWEAFEGYSRTDDALVLRRSWWFDTRFALDDLDDPDAVEAALARYLPAA